MTWQQRLLQWAGWSPTDTVALANMVGPTEPSHTGGMPNVQIGSGPQVVNWPVWWHDVSEREALTLPAFWRCCHLVADTIAALPPHAYRDLDRIVPTPSLLSTPSPSRSRFTVIQSLMESTLVHGNGLALLSEPDRLGWPQRMRPIHPMRVWAKAVDGEVEEYLYFPQLADGSTASDPVRINPTDMFHVRGMTIAGDAFGCGILEYHQRQLTLVRNQVDHASSWWEDAGIPSGLLKMANPNPSQEAVDKAKERWMAQHGGPKRTPAVLAGDVDYKPLASTPEATQLLQSRQYSNLEIALMFGVPPTMLEAQQPGASMTYQNVEQQGIAFIRDTLLPWLTQLEELFTVQLPGVQYARFNVDALMRASTLDRFRGYDIGIKAGFLKEDEVRRWEGLRPWDDPQEVPRGRSLRVMGENGNESDTGKATN